MKITLSLYKVHNFSIIVNFQLAHNVYAVLQMLGLNRFQFKLAVSTPHPHHFELLYRYPGNVDIEKLKYYTIIP